MINDGHPNPTSPPTPDEESSLSGGLSSSKAAVEVPVLSEDGSRTELRGERTTLLHGASDLDHLPSPTGGRGVGGEGGGRGVEPVSGYREKSPQKTPPIKMDEESPLQDEIDSLRRALQRLVKSFSNTETLDEQLKLSSAINYTTASITRLVRAQQFLRDHQPNTNEQAVDRAITAVLKEWGRI